MFLVVLDTLLLTELSSTEPVGKNRVLHGTGTLSHHCLQPHTGS
ncbi:unnamed protein product [Gulo gulo]|uniref:Uncharacterized protein n=1 Tax=Gulo gulo TaxID=48420 RepID=A0A9X9LNL9_GULGU|nr:unnamed protein product [Gulo gulo]